MTNNWILRAKAVALAAAGAVTLVAAPAAAPDSLDLDAALRFAVENNHTIKQARERIRQQEGVVIEARALLIPNLAATSSYSRNAKEISTYSPARNQSWSIGIQAKQTVYAGGAVSASVKSSKLSREAAVLELQGVINDQLYLVRSRFFTVLLNRQRIEVQEENVKLLTEQLTTAKNRFEAGSSSQFDLLRAEVALANGRPALIQARNDYRVSIDELRQVLGMTSKLVSKTPEVVGTLVLGKHEEPQLSDALSTAQANRPELLRVAKLAEASEQQVKGARAGYLPSVEVFGGYDWGMGYPTSAWNDRRDGWTAGVKGQWNIFDGKSTAGKLVQARSRLNQARLSVDEANFSVEVEVRRALSSLQEAWELVESTGKAVQQAEEAMRLANVRYSAGTATQLDVLTTQVALTDARLNQLTSIYNCNMATAALNKALGKAESYQVN